MQKYIFGFGIASLRLVHAESGQHEDALIDALHAKIVEKTSSSTEQKAVLGTAEGLGLRGLRTDCVETGSFFSNAVDEAVNAMTKKTDVTMKAGIRDLGLALTVTLPKSLHACSVSHATIAETVDVLNTWMSPEWLSYEPGHKLRIYDVDVFHNVNDAIAAWKHQNYNAFGYKIGQALATLKNASSKHASALSAVTPAEDAAAFSEGLFQGFGVDIPTGCVTSDESFSKLLDEAFVELEKGTPAGITLGLELMARAYRIALPRVERECGEVVEEVNAELKKAFADVETPFEIIVKIGKNIQVNKVEIFSEVSECLLLVREHRFQSGGQAMGKALKKIVLGSDKGLLEKAMDIFV